MSETLVVHLNRNRPHDIDVTGAFEASDGFTVELRNHGAAVHVHLHLDDALSQTATLSNGNHFVDDERTRAVSVDVRAGDRPVTGRLTVATGYGARTEYVTVRIVEPEETEEFVAVDESLGEPQRGDDDPERSPLVERVGLDESAPVVVLAAVAVAVAGSAALLVDSGVVLFGLAVVLVGVGTALYILTH